MLLFSLRKVIGQMKRLILILLVLLLPAICVCEEEVKDPFYGTHGILSNFNEEKDIKRWWVYKGKISIAKDPKNIKEGAGALEWRYEVRNQKWNLLAINKIPSTKFRDKEGLAVWLKSNKTASLLLQFVEKDGTNYQYFNIAKPVELDWKLFEIGFDEFILDKDTPDNNNKLDLNQIDRLEIVEVAGFFKTLGEGARTVWIDDLKLTGGGKTVDDQKKTEWPIKATGGVSREKGMFGQGILYDNEQEKVVFNTKNNLNPTQGTIEMWVKPLRNEETKKKALFSSEWSPDIFGRKGNEIILYLHDSQLVFQANNLVLSSPKLQFLRERFYYIAVSWDNQGTVLYFDGRKVAENNNKNLGKIPKEMVIGNLGNGTAPSQAIIDEVRISSLKRSGEEILASSKKSQEFVWDSNTLFLAHFNDSILSEIVIKHGNFKIGEKISFELIVPTPIVTRQTNNRHKLRYEVLDKANIVKQGEKMLTCTMGDLSGQKNNIKLDIESPLQGGEYKLRLKLFSDEDLLNKGEQTFQILPLPEKDTVSASAKLETPVSPKEWYKNVQAFGIVPLPIAEAKEFNITVNGVWGGSHTADPVLTKENFSPAIRRKYKTDTQFVSAMHNNGLLACGGMVAASGNNTSMKIRPELRKAISKTAQGKNAISWLEDSYLMSTSNPIWYNWMINLAKKAIDSEVDLVMFDDVQEFQFPFHCGFDSYSNEEFKKYLRSNFTLTELNKRFGIVDVDNLLLAQRITDKAGQDYEKRIKADPLVDVFARFHEEKNYHAKKHIIEALRRYAEEKNRKIAIAANIMALGTTRFDGYWSKGLHFSELVDFFAFESLYSVGGKKVVDMSLPRGKWVAWEKLSMAATKGPAVPLLAAEAVEQLQGKKISNYLYILTAEAYANQGAHILWHAPSYGLGKQWRKSADAAGFILKHRDLYEKEQSVYSSSAILYLYSEGMRTKTFTYLGLAQALAESNIPFEVVFSGDDYYLKDTLTLHDLTKYKLILIPSVVDITDNQKEIIKKYVANGGRAIIVDPFEMNIYQSEGEIKFGKGSFIIMPSLNIGGKPEDPGSAYNLTYNDMIRKDIKKTVNKYVEDAIVINNSDRKIIAYPYYQIKEKRMVIHLINYDHNFKNDKVEVKKNIRIRIRKPDFYTGQREAFMISPDIKNRVTLPIILRDGYLELEIPELIVYNIILL